MATDRKQINLLVIAITILAVGLLTWSYVGHWQTRPSQQSTTTTMNNSGSMTMLPENQIPSAIPQDIVIDKNAKIVSNYTGVTAEGKAQSTLVYSSQESSSQLITTYIQYFSKNGWRVQAFVGTIPPGAKSIPVPDHVMASQSGSVITVNVAKDPNIPSTNLVSVNMTQ